jgi:ankyrin repeat protein
MFMAISCHAHENLSFIMKSIRDDIKIRKGQAAGAKRSLALADELFEAIDAHDPVWIERALGQGASPKAASKRHAQRSPLEWALRHASPRLDIVKLLSSAGAVVGPAHLALAADKDCMDVFLFLAGQAPGSQAFQSAGPDSVALACALCAREDQFEALKMALERGADPNRKDARGFAPLMLAANAGWVEQLQLLTSHGARLDDQCFAGTTALMFALRHDDAKASAACGKLLVDLGCDVNLATQRGPNQGATPLMSAASRNRLEVAQLLVGAGADLGARALNGRCAAMCAAAHGALDCLAFLNARTDCLSAVDLVGRDCAMVAAINGSLDCLAFLAHQGASLRSVDKTGRTCLEWARAGSHFECCSFIEARRSREDLESSLGSSVLEPGRSIRL